MIDSVLHNFSDLIERVYDVHFGCRLELLNSMKRTIYVDLRGSDLIPSKKRGLKRLLEMVDLCQRKVAHSTAVSHLRKRVFMTDLLRVRVKRVFRLIIICLLVPNLD